jgi:crotonobetainyl-CoA:carnitine CoA-transferase CaiB-like acyl-CoA transferase
VHGASAQQLHRNKKSLSPDLKSPADREVLGRLVDRADVLIENMRPQVKHRLGFDYDTVHARNPRLAALCVRPRVRRTVRASAVRRGLPAPAV